MRILVTNDDGVNAQGLIILRQIAETLSDDVWVVAPELEQSCASHSLSLRKPLRIRSITSRYYAVDGTPTDCVLLAVKEIMKEQRPDLVLSGVNRGANLGEDVTYSGTIAAAMEGTLLDIPSIAFSQSISPDKPIHWETAHHYAGNLITRIIGAGIADNTLININFPDLTPENVKGIRTVPQGKRKLGDNLYRNIDPEGKPYYWIGPVRNIAKDPQGSDLEAISEGYITVTPLYLDLTNYAAIEPLNTVLNLHNYD